MRRKDIVIFLSLVLLISHGITGIVYGSEGAAETIKVALETPLKSNIFVRVGASKGFFISKDTGDLKNLAVFSDETILIRTDAYIKRSEESYEAASDLANATIGPIHLALASGFQTYEEALAKVEDLAKQNIIAYPVYDGSFEVWMGYFTDSDRAEEMKGSLESSLDTDIKLVNGREKKIIIENVDGDVLLMYDRNEQLILTPAESKNSALLQVEDHKYRGDLLFNVVNDELKVINKLSLWGRA